MDTLVFDDHTLELEQLLLEIATSASLHRKRYFIGGGFAIDLNFGKLTRGHDDIDFHPVEEDIDWWQRWFQNKRYIISKDPDMRDFPYAFLLKNEKNEYIADVYPVKIGIHGEIYMYESDDTYHVWDGKSWKKVNEVIYKGVSIYVEDAESVLNQKIEHSHKHNLPLEEKHKHDLRLYGKSRKT